MARILRTRVFLEARNGNGYFGRGVMNEYNGYMCKLFNASRIDMYRWTHCDDEVSRSPILKSIHSISLSLGGP